MAIRKYEITYGPKGKIEKREVPFVGSWNTKPVDNKKPTPAPAKPQKPANAEVRAESTPATPNLNRGGRTEEVVKACREQNIKDPAIVTRMVREAYAGQKKEGYIVGRIKHALAQLKL